MSPRIYIYSPFISLNFVHFFSFTFVFCLNRWLSLEEELVLWFAHRLELKGNKYVLGEFLEFKGKQEDLQALRNIKRSKVSRLIIQKTSMLGLGNLESNKIDSFSEKIALLDCCEMDIFECGLRHLYTSSFVYIFNYVVFNLS